MRCFSLKDSRAAADLEKANKEKEKLQGQVEALKKAAQVRSHCFVVLFLVCHLIMQLLLSYNLIHHSGALMLFLWGQHKADMSWKDCKGWVREWWQKWTPVKLPSSLPLAFFLLGFLISHRTLLSEGPFIFYGEGGAGGIWRSVIWKLYDPPPQFPIFFACPPRHQSNFLEGPPPHE